MQQADAETLPRSTSDHKVVPETLPDYAAESFYLPKEDELDWFDSNVFYCRNESTKANSNPVSSTQRLSFNLKSKPSILGLPKPQKTSYGDSKFRRNCKPGPGTTQFFPKRSRSSGKSNIPLSEPGSPKVSCIGRVRSKKERSRSRRNRSKRRSKQTEERVVEPAVRTGLWKRLKAALGLGRPKTQAVIDVDTPTMETKNFMLKKPVGLEAPAGLGGLNRFVSGRRSESWGGRDVDLEVAVLDESDREDGSMWHRRGVGPPSMVDCRRDWELVGPDTV